jgi:hypothetical protein
MFLCVLEKVLQYGGVAKNMDKLLKVIDFTQQMSSTSLCPEKFMGPMNGGWVSQQHLKAQGT